MIFVTVGTTLPFDDLLRVIDGLVEGGEIAEPVICQIGHGKFLPSHCEHFRFKPDLDGYIDGASLIIGHGGTGTVTGLLASGKPFVAVANPLGAGDHQAQFLERLNRVVSFLWTADLQQLPNLIHQALTYSSTVTGCERLSDDLKIFLRQNP